MPTAINKAIFLDRDGVINEEGRGYIGKLQDFRIIPGALEAIKGFNSAGFLVFVISNQSGVSRGYYTKEDVEETTDYLLSQLDTIGGKIEEIHYCFHGPEDTCDCRKPNPKILRGLITRYNINTKVSFFISDTKNDLEMAKTQGIKTVWINSNPNHPKNTSKIVPDYTAISLKAIYKNLLQHKG